MLIIKSCLAVIVLAHTTTAFVPWFPDYRCKEFNTCKGKRAAEATTQSRGLEHVEIIQRIAENSLPHDLQVQRLAQRLTHKYQRGTPTKALAERDYKIVPAAQPTTANSLGIDQDGTDFSYFAKVQVGSKGQVLNMALDTGAGTTWVMGHECKSAPCTTHNNFNTTESTSYNNTKSTFELHYGSGNVTGTIATDSFSLAGFVVKPTFGIALTASDDFNNFPIDGILGLAQSKGDHDTFTETLAKAKILEFNRFGVSISRSTDGANTGVINFGTLDNSRYTGELAYSQVAQDKKDAGDWAIPMEDISFDGKKAGIEFKVAYIDTGTSYIFANQSEVKKLHSVIPGATSEDGITWRVPCTTTQDLILTIGANTYSIASRDWVGPKKDDVCTSNVYGYDVVPNAWLLGDTFLKNVYAVFDFDKYEIGLASRPPPPLVVPTTSSGGPLSSPTSTVASDTDGPTGTGSHDNVASSSNTLIAGSTAAVPTDATGAPIAGATHLPGTGSHQTSSSPDPTAEAIESSATPSPTPGVSNKSAANDLRVSTALACLGLLAFFL